MATVTETVGTETGSAGANGKGKKGKKPMPNYFTSRGLPEDTVVTGLPGDYRIGVDSPLLEKNFEDGFLYLKYRKVCLELKLANLQKDISAIDKEIAGYQKYDTAAKRELYSKTRSAQRRFQKMLDELASEGADVSDFLMGE